MNDYQYQEPIYDLVGFDYPKAVSELLARLTYAQIAYRVGYSSVGSVDAVRKGHTPSHRHGEAIWALYIEIFGRKPPLIQNFACPST